jgi:hypothetical protein
MSNQYNLTISTGSDYTKTFTIKENGVAKDLTLFSATMYLIKSPGVFSSITFSTTNGKITNGGITGTLTLLLTPADILTIDGEFYKLEIDDGTTQTEILSGNLFLLNETKSGVEYLIPFLRLYIGDTNPLAYRYLDEWLKMSLLTSIKSLERWWKSKYLVNDDTQTISRNPDFTFIIAEPPVITTADEMPIIIMASIIIKSGSLENNSWNMATWRDAEYYVSNVEGGKQKELGVKADWDRLLMYLKPPQKRLNAGAREAFNFGADETT